MNGPNLVLHSKCIRGAGICLSYIIMAPVTVATYKAKCITRRTGQGAGEHDYDVGDIGYVGGLSTDGTRFILNKTKTSPMGPGRWALVADWESEEELTPHGKVWPVWSEVTPLYPKQPKDLSLLITPGSTSTSTTALGKRKSINIWEQGGPAKIDVANTGAPVAPYTLPGTNKGVDVTVVGYKGPDHLMVELGGVIYWAKTSDLTPPPANPSGKVLGEYTGDVTDKLTAFSVTMQAPVNQGTGDKRNILVQTGDFFWAGLVAVGLFFHSIDKGMVNVLVMPLLRMFKEPEHWVYEVRMAPTTTTPKPPTAGDAGGWGQGEIRYGPKQVGWTGTGAALAGMSFSTLAFFSWPFRKWAGDEYITDPTIAESPQRVTGLNAPTPFDMAMAQWREDTRVWKQNGSTGPAPPKPVDPSAPAPVSVFLTKKGIDKYNKASADDKKIAEAAYQLALLKKKNVALSESEEEACIP